MKKIFFVLVVSFLLSSPCWSGEWNLTGSLNEGRSSFSSEILDNGDVLVAGGLANSGGLSSCEIYNPQTGQWSETDSMTFARRDFSLVKFRHNGINKILSAGGTQSLIAEIFDPQSLIWTETGSIHYQRLNARAIAFPDPNNNENDLVLVVGGDWENDYKGCEIYNPDTGIFALTGFCSYPKLWHTLELLSDGRVMAIGGGNSNYAHCEIYDPSTEIWTEIDNLNEQRIRHTSHLLPNGNPIAIAGDGTQYNSSCEIYDFQMNQWSFADSLEIGRTGHCSELLLNNKILVISGLPGWANNSCELYECETNEWQTATSTYYPYGNFSSEILKDERVLAIRSWCEIYTWNYMPIAQLQGPNQGTIGEGLTFSVFATDPDNDSIAVRIDWGDDEIIEWTELVPSGTTMEFSHSYTQYGQYEIRAQVADQWFFINQECHNSISLWSQPFIITITGVPQISVSVDSLNFGSVYIGEDSTKTVTISNSGNGILEAELSTGTNEFSIYPENFNLEPEETLDVEITFTPSYEGIILDVLTILSNDPQCPELQIELIGEGKILTGVNGNLISINSLRAYPNPFNSKITISFSSDEVRPHQAEISVFNIKGQVVKTWTLNQTTSRVVWNGKDDAGKSVTSGIYFCKYHAGGLSSPKKIILLK